MKNGSTTITTIDLTSDSGIYGNGSTYTIDADKCSTDYYKVVTFSNALSQDTQFTFTATTGKRFVVWGVNAEAFAITAESNNNSYGTVSLSGSTITASPETGYRVSTTTPYTISPEGSATVSQSGNTFTVTPSENTIVTINFEAIPTHKATFMVNGSAYQEVDAAEDDDISFPAEPSAMCGLSFVGWVDTPIEGTTDTKPDFVTSATMGTSDITYYAVFANEFTTTGIITDELTFETVGVTGTSYTEWSGKKFVSDAVYAGYSAGGNSSIQLRSNNSNSGIITTASGGKAKKITVDWNKNTSSGRILNVYGKNTAYSAVTELYNTSNQGTLLGTIVYGTSTELTIASNYEYIGLRSASGAMYLTSISIEWEGETTGHNGYCTTIPAPTAVVSAAGWATWNAPCAVSFPAGVSAYLVTENTDPAKVSLIEVSDVPANTPVLLEASAGTYTMDMIESSTTSTEGNLLRVSTGTNSGTLYVLAKIDEVVGFYMWDPSKTLPEGKIYLEMPGSTNPVRPFIALPGEETGISDMNRETVTNNRYFDLQGRRVAQPTKGMYIVNGKKVVVK